MEASEMKEINICGKLNGNGKQELKGLKPQDNEFIYDPEQNTNNTWKYALWNSKTYEVKEISTFKVISHNPRISKLIETKIFIV
jgi:hypothetical protein